MRVILVNKATNQKLALSLKEFEARFKLEIEQAKQAYFKQEIKQNEALPQFMKKEPSEKDFMLSLVWNFNNYASSDWYIRSIRQLKKDKNPGKRGFKAYNPCSDILYEKKDSRPVLAKLSESFG